ncbi:3'-5' exonuclease [Streptomyces sp. NPDC060194]|uniref:3'-5' exonuclease n=1 Tax=Streptomyces sp. NPDC060194 TaxID=3347069 RepID=UPI00364CBC17
MTTGWHRDLLIGFDLETTGTDPGTSRIVTAAVVEVRAGETVGLREWLADPGVPIPADATAVHGVTDARARAEGRPAAEVADEIADALAGHWRAGVPVAAYNAAFDLSLLAAELRRHALPSLRERLGGAAPGPVVDPLTIDRAVDKYRRGKRTLEAACAEYGVRLSAAHEAGADALAAVLVGCAIADRHPWIAALTPDDLHDHQVEWYAAWAADFESFRRRKGSSDATIDPAWPLRELPRAAALPRPRQGGGVPDGRPDATHAPRAR